MLSTTVNIDTLFPNLIVLDWIALTWFVFCWVGYNYFSRHRSRRIPRLQNELQKFIVEWSDVLLRREQRMVDIQVVANVERSATLMASSSLLIIAGLMTAIGSTDTAINFISDLPFSAPVTRQAWELRILLLVVIFVYAFFKFTWCVRQYGMVSILAGSAPLDSDTNVSEQSLKKYSATMARVVWLAVYSFNLGLRAFYFSLGLLAWFVHPIAFILSTTLVVAVLYRREFRSKTLRALTQGRADGESINPL